MSNLKLFISNLFCRHKYKLINQFEMMSEFDIIVSNGKIPNTHNSITRKMVTDYQCEKCNKLKRFESKTIH